MATITEFGHGYFTSPSYDTFKQPHLVELTFPGGGVLYRPLGHTSVVRTGEGEEKEKKKSDHRITWAY